MTAPKEMRIPLRGAVVEVLGHSGSALVGDDLAQALFDAGFRLFRPDDCEKGQEDGVTFRDNPEGTHGLILLIPEHPSYVANKQTYWLVPTEEKP